MADLNPRQKQVQLNYQRRAGRSTRVADGAKRGINRLNSQGSAAATPTIRDREQTLRNSNASPSLQRQAVELSKSLVTGQRNRRASLDRQVVGEAGARAGQLAGSVIGSYIPVLGTAIGAALGKRFGRAAGEHWRFTLASLLAMLFLQMLLWTIAIGSLVVLIVVIVEEVKKKYGPLLKLMEYLS